MSYRSSAPHRGRWIAAIIVVAFAALSLGSVGGYAVAAGFFADKKAEKAYAAMMASLQPATAQQAAALQKQAASSNDGLNVAASRRVFIAKKGASITLAPVKEPMVVVLPAGTSWAGGSQGNILLLRTDGVAPGQLEKGRPFPNLWCAADLKGLSYNQCDNPYANESATYKQMTKDMRRPTVAELNRWLGDEFRESSIEDYWVATRDFRAAPEYKQSVADGPGDLTVGIFLIDGARVQGGQLGFTFVKRIAEGIEGEWIMDAMCHENAEPVTFTPKNSKVKKDTPNMSHPATFAPVHEIERVSSCRG